MPPSAYRWLWLLLGFAALGLGLLGVLLPLLPTTPFILLAAFAFARSSQRWHDWLMRHPVFGQLIQDWQRHGAIGRRAKRVAIASLVLVCLISLALGVPTPYLLIQIGVLVVCAGFILSRPTPPS